MTNQVLFMVSTQVEALYDAMSHVLVYAREREDAKRQAHPLLCGDPERYTVTPLTTPGDQIRVAITLTV